MAKYTNFFTLILFVACFVLIFSCKTQHKIVFEKNDLCCKDSIVTKNMYLSNRMPDCDMAIRYMDSVVRNGLLYYDTSKAVPNIIEGRFSIFCDSTDLYSSKKIFYYINMICFEERPCEDFFQVFCPDSSSEIFKILESVSFSREDGIRFYLFSNSDFDMVVEIKKGLIKKINFRQRQLIINK